MSADLAWFLVIAWAASALAGYFIGRSKGLGVQGFFLGLLLGFVGLIVIAVLETADAKHYPNVGLRWWGGPSSAVQLAEIHRLRQEGLISEQEFLSAKQPLLPRSARTRPPATQPEPVQSRTALVVLSVTALAVTAAVGWAAVSMIPDSGSSPSSDAPTLFAELEGSGWECNELSDTMSSCSVAGDPAEVSITADGSDITIETENADDDEVDPDVMFEWIRSDFGIPVSVWNSIMSSRYSGDDESIGDYFWSWSNDGNLTLSINVGR